MKDGGCAGKHLFAETTHVELTASTLLARLSEHAACRQRLGIQPVYSFELACFLRGNRGTNLRLVLHSSIFGTMVERNRSPSTLVFMTHHDIRLRPNTVWRRLRDRQPERAVYALSG